MLPIFYMEDCFLTGKEEFRWNTGSKVMWQFEHCKPQMDVEGFFQNYQEIKENICFKLINYERNRAVKKSIKRILDLAMVFYYRIQKDETMQATILIEYAHLNAWKITQEELIENAKRYTYLKLPAEFINMEGSAGSGTGKEKQMS